MTCSECSSHILDDCLYCPKCGKPTALSAERSVGIRRPIPPNFARVAPSRPEPPPPPRPVAPVEIAEAARLAPEPPTPVATVQADPRVLNTRLTQANLSRVRGNWSEAIDHCVAVLQADPGNAAAHALLGDIYAARGRREDAAQWYRMAVELHPNPIDEGKLHRIEREIAQQETPARNGRRILLEPAVVPSDGQAPVGTVALMGVSPRLWLRGITVAALAFLVVSGGILLGTRNRSGAESAIPRPTGYEGQVNSIAPAPGTIGSLPPPRIGGPSILPPGQAPNAAPSPQVGGSGLAPDSNPSAHTVPTASPDTRQAGGTTPVPSPAPYANVPTAPVQGVRPMAHTNDIPAFATLSGGMKLAKISSLASGNEQVLVLANPPAASDQENFRQNAIRNVYRAARNAFATNSDAKEASVYIQTDVTEKGGTLLLAAHVDRDSALKSDPEAERPESLANRLRSVQWGQ